MPTGFERYPKLYGSTRWRRLRKLVHKRDCYLCLICKKMGRLTAVDDSDPVDHKQPHKGDPALFFDIDNCQSVCRACHDTIKKMQEKHGYSAACGVDGMPLDESHPWQRGKKVTDNEE
jgi:5-methylcytosine-specific restriction enzyme A